MSNEKTEKPKKIVMHTLYKPNGDEMRVNENSLKHGLSIGWTKEKPKASK